MRIDYKRLAGVLFLVLLALVSLFFLGEDDSPFVRRTENKIETQIEGAKTLSSSSVIASVVITILPSDVATPVAEEVAKLTQYFIVALVFLYAEKFLMAIFGFGVFKVVIPAACFIFAALQFKKNKELKKITVRVTAFALILFFAVPIGAEISNKIYVRYAPDIDEIVRSAITVTSSDGEEQGIQGIASEKLNGRTAGFTNKISALYHAIIDILAVILVTSCVIPLLVLVFLLWLLNKIFDLYINLSGLKRGGIYVRTVRSRGNRLNRANNTEREPSVTDGSEAQDQ